MSAPAPKPAQRDPRSISGAWSVPATRRRVLDLLDGIDWPRGKVCDVGAGSGLFSQVLCDYVRERHGLEPREHVFACDLIPSSFHYDEIECRATNPDGRLPFDDGTFDATISIEVIEHVEDQFGFFRELARVTKPGGIVVATTPNTLNMNSRLRTLLQGFPLLFDPLPRSRHDPRFLGGHIHPISPYFLAYDALRAGLVELELHSDRTKRSAVFYTALLSPLLVAGTALHRARLRRKEPDVFGENAELVRSLSSWGLLTGRTAILRGVKPV